MEVFSPDREPAAVFALIAQLSELGIQGRDASYLASIKLAGSDDPAVRARHLAEFHYMVTPEKRAAAASLIGLIDPA